MESKRQKQVAELVKRNFGLLLQQEGEYIYGTEALVTVTSVKMSPDMGIAKIYLSVYNTLNKQAIILEMETQLHRLRQGLGQRIRKHVRRIPEIQLYLDDTLDEMYRLNALFNKLEDENQMGERPAEGAEADSDA
ncbi:MAG: 30S ribosome-binding factor RbfA [Bacteroidota bacterium]